MQFAQGNMPGVTVIGSNGSGAMNVPMPAGGSVQFTDASGQPVAQFHPGDNQGQTVVTPGAGGVATAEPRSTHPGVFENFNCLVLLWVTAPCIEMKAPGALESCDFGLSKITSVPR